MEAYKNTKILRIRENHSEPADDVVAVERKVRISVNGKHLLSLYCTPLMIREFVAGIVQNEGLISGEWCAERMSIEYGDEIAVDIPASGTVYEGEKTITSGCAGGISIPKGLPEQPIHDNTVISYDRLRQVFREFQKMSGVYRITGGVHSAALSDGNRILAFAEDIGRHNAVDKVIGYCILESVPFEGRLMLASGRLSSEIVLKCARCRIPFVVSRAAPTSLAVDIARKAGLTLIGFMRGEKMNVYTGAGRISLEGKDLVPHDDDLKAQ